MMSELAPDPKESRERPATACLEAADRHRAPLLALAGKLAGSRRVAWTSTSKRCSIAMVRFSGWASPASATSSTHGRPSRTCTTSRPASSSAWSTSKLLPQAAPAASAAHAQLAEQVATEARTRFTPGERVVVLRLHAEGYSYQNIAGLTGAGDRFRVRRQLDRLKDSLRETFRQAWNGLWE